MEPSPRLTSTDRPMLRRSRAMSKRWSLGLAQAETDNPGTKELTAAASNTKGKRKSLTVTSNSFRSQRSQKISAILRYGCYVPYATRYALHKEALVALCTKCQEGEQEGGGVIVWCSTV